MTNLTKNFSLAEFQAKGFPLSPTAKEMFLLRKLCLKLQVIRDALGCGLAITDCYRTVDKYKAMLAKGLNPSETSDHFWGQAVPVNSPQKIAKYGNVFDVSVGAVDMVPAMDIFKAYNKISELARPTADRPAVIDVGQAILEESATAKWIHLSNHPSVLFSDSAVRVLIPERQQFLASKDGGKTYNPVV